MFSYHNTKTIPFNCLELRWTVFNCSYFESYVLITVWEVNSRAVWSGLVVYVCCLLADGTIKFSTSVSSGKLSAPQRNLRNNFSGFIGKSASFPCLWNPFPGFGRNPRQQKMRKSISAKMWWLGLHYLLVAWNLRQGTIEQIEFVEKFLASMDTGQPQSLTVT